MKVESLFFYAVVILGLLGCFVGVWGINKLEANKQTLLEEIAIRDSYIEDLCSAIDADKDNFRTSCKDIMDANDYGRAR